jgi:hypothetical protein
VVWRIGSRGGKNQLQVKRNEREGEGREREGRRRGVREERENMQMQN